MATALHDIPRLLTVEEFLEIDFGDSKVELDNGRIYMMAGGTFRHARVSRNILTRLTELLRGSGCVPYGSEAGFRPHNFSLRYPDVSIYCGDDLNQDDATFQRTPKVVFEVLSASTARTDLNVKMLEYRQVDSLDAIVFVDAVKETVRTLYRRADRSWAESDFAAVDVDLRTFGVTLTQAEIFAPD